MGYGDVDGMNMRHHHLLLRCYILFPEIAADPFLQVFCLSDIDDFGTCIQHLVNSWTLGQAFQERLDIESGSRLDGCGH